MNDFLKKLVPMLGTAIAGPLGGMALEAIGAALGSKTNDKSDIEKALSSATPDQLLALKKAEQEFTARMAELGYNNVRDLEAIAAGDRKDARAMHVALNEMTPTVLAYAVTSGFFGVLGYVIAYGLPEKGGDAILILLGTLSTAWISVVSFYYGTTQNSAKKDVTIADLRK